MFVHGVYMILEHLCVMDYSLSQPFFIVSILVVPGSLFRHLHHSLEIWNENGAMEYESISKTCFGKSDLFRFFIFFQFCQVSHFKFRWSLISRSMFHLTLIGIINDCHLPIESSSYSVAYLHNIKRLVCEIYSYEQIYCWMCLVGTRSVIVWFVFRQLPCKSMLPRR